MQKCSVSKDTMIPDLMELDADERRGDGRRIQGLERDRMLMKVMRIRVRTRRWTRMRMRVRV